MHESNHLSSRKELVLLDDSNPRSIAKLMPESFALQMQKLWDSDDASFLLGKTERELLKELVRRGKAPSAIDHKIRVKLWVEYERVQEEIPRMPKMNMLNILGLDFPKETFYRFYITDPCRLAWILCPPSDYSTMIDIILLASCNRLLDILDAPLLAGYEQVIDTVRIEKIVKINETMHRRKFLLEKVADDEPDKDQNGGHGDANAPSTSPPSEPTTDDEKAKYLAELQLKLGKMPGVT